VYVLGYFVMSANQIEKEAIRQVVRATRRTVARAQ
jgi:hypothetical protein